MLPSLDKSGTISLVPSEEWLMWYYSLGMMFQVPGSLYVQFIYFSPVVIQPGISLKLVAFDSKDVEQAEVHQANMKNLHCCVKIQLKMHRNVCFSLYTGLMLMFPSLFRVSLLLIAF